MIRFEHLSYLYTLAIVPVALALFVWMIYWRIRKLKQLGDQQLIGTQLIGFIPGRNSLKFILVSVGLVCICIGLANLQSGDKMEKIQRKGIDVVFALDVSKSMWAKDIQPDRLTRAKQLIMLMLDKMHNDRVALIVFAGRPYLQVPLTVDYGAVKMLLQNASPDMVPTQGTVIGDAIDMATTTFTQNEKKFKSLVIISDGEDHDESAIQKAREAADAGIVIHTVGVGSPQGATLYDPATKAAKLDENGNPVISKLNEDELRSIANAGRGTYNLLVNSEDVATRVAQSFNSMEQKNLTGVEFIYTSYFQWFLAIGLLFIVIDLLIPGAKSLKLKVA
jgi:Ca-activated chloride channel homolog